MQIALWSLAIFFGRIADVTLGTLRINFIVKHRKVFAALVGFIEVTIFILVISRVIQDINSNIFGVLAYGAGFASGTAIGMTISDKLSRDMISINIITKKKEQAITDMLREAGFGATTYQGVGREGKVCVINVVCKQSCLAKINDVVFDIDSSAFLYTNPLGTQRGGYLYGIKKK